MKKTLKAVLPVVIIIVVILSMVYTNPVPLGKLAQGAELSQCTSVTASFTVYLGEEQDSPSHALTVRRGEEGFDRLLALAEGKRFARSFHSLFAGNKVETPAPMTGDVTLFLAYELPAGTLTIRTIGDGSEVLLSWGDNTWQGSLSNMAQWVTGAIGLINEDASG